MQVLLGRIIVNRATVRARIELQYTFAFFATPIDEERIVVHSMLSMKRFGNRLATALLMRKALNEGRVTIGQDVPIRENKIDTPQAEVVR